MVLRVVGALTVLAGVVAAQSTPLDVKPNPPAEGIQGPVVLTEGETPQLRLVWVDGAREVTLHGERLAQNSWLFAEDAGDTPSPSESQAGLASAVARTTEVDVPVPQKLGTVNASALNLRAGPSTSHAVVRRAARHEELVVVGRQGSWLKLEDNGQTVWAHRNYVRQAGAFVPGRRSISLQRRGSSYKAVIREGKTVLATQQLRDAKPTVLLVAVEDDQGFPTSLVGLKRYYRQKGYRVNSVIEGDSEGLVKLLKAAAKATPYSRVVVSTHSGWDGPMWDDGQISPGEDEFDVLVEALQRGTTENAKVYISGCHAAGSNRYESASNKIWVRDVARMSGRTVGGPTGSTSAAEHTMRQTLAVLEGEGTVIQETVLATPTTVTRWGGGVKRTTIPNVEPEGGLTSIPPVPVINFDFEDFELPDPVIVLTPFELEPVAELPRVEIPRYRLDATQN